ncbi:MAG: GTP-binding protein [Bacillaceae bacterium]|nr:GTP-binding protein [Bacillaceae bacterium]
MNKVPITVITGMIGAGKTKISNRLIHDKKSSNCKVQVLVYYPDTITVVEDISTKRQYRKLPHQEQPAKLITTQEQLISEMISYSKDKQPLDELIIELAAGIPPQFFVEELCQSLEKVKLDKTFYIQSIVSVIDAQHFWFDYTSNHYVIYTNDNDRMEHTFAEVMISQIEFCSHIVINKCNFISKESLDETVSFIKKLQPKVQIIFSADGQVASQTFHSVNDVDLHQIKSNIGWKLELKNNSSTLNLVEKFGINSFIYESHSPIQLEKLEEWFRTFPSEILRSAGYLRTYSEAHGLELLYFSQVGASVIIETVDEHCTDTTARSKVVFFGFDLEDVEVTQQLNQCLMENNNINQTVV